MNQPEGDLALTSPACPSPVAGPRAEGPVVSLSLVLSAGSGARRLPPPSTPHVVSLELGVRGAETLR